MNFDISRYLRLEGFSRDCDFDGADVALEKLQVDVQQPEEIGRELKIVELVAAFNIFTRKTMPTFSESHSDLILVDGLEIWSNQLMAKIKSSQLLWKSEVKMPN